MSEWTLENWEDENGHSPLEDWFDTLTNEQFAAIAREMKLLELAGNRLRLPHSKALEDKLFELRERSFGFRIYYTFRKGKIILLLCGGTKDSQDRDIRSARKMLAKVHADEKGKAGQK
jgi:putative addiction module killer protein